MALTILEQVLENVRHGAIVPALANVAEGEPSSGQIARLSDEIVSEFHVQLEAAVDTALLDCRSRQIEVAQCKQELLKLFHVRLQVVLEDFLGGNLVFPNDRDEHVTGSGLLDQDPSTLSAPSPEGPEQHRAMAELQQVMAAAQLENQERDPKLVQQIDGVAKEYSSEKLGRERSHDALVDIHKMIEFLK